MEFGFFHGSELIKCMDRKNIKSCIDATQQYQADYYDFLLYV